MQVVIEKKMRDPRAKKLKDHRKNYKTKLGKERTEIRRTHFRSFRRKNKEYCNSIIKYKNIEELPEPVFKKTGGRITW